MPCSATAAPRMKLPPPMTMATSTPSSWIFPISSARYRTYSGEMPNFRSPRSASPESLSSTRRYFAPSRVVIAGSLCLSEREPLEAPHRDVLTRLRRDRGDEVLDRLRRVADVRLRVELVDVRRRHRRDLHRDLLRELLEVLAARDEVGLARHLDERADPAAAVDVRGDDAFLGLASRLLRRRRDAALGEQLLRLLVVAVGVLERSL